MVVAGVVVVAATAAGLGSSTISAKTCCIARAPSPPLAPRDGRTRSVGISLHQRRARPLDALLLDAAHPVHPRDEHEWDHEQQLLRQRAPDEFGRRRATSARRAVALPPPSPSPLTAAAPGREKNPHRMAELHIVGQLVGAADFPLPSLFCKFSIDAGHNFRLLQGSSSGQT